MKEDSTATEQLRQLEELLPVASDDAKPKIEQDIRLIKAGIIGEERIGFELRNSHIPMWVLHDIYLKGGDLSAQIDYLIITRRCIFVVECKNLFGNVEIDSSGNFIRTVQYGKRFIKEGIYSPITQNARHLELIKALRAETKTNILAKKLFEKSFYDTYRTVVVLANPQTVLNAKYAKRDIKQQVIRADRLIAYIKEINDMQSTDYCNDQQAEELAQFFLDKNTDNPVDFLSKYKAEQAAETVPEKSAQTEPETDTIVCPKCGAPMVKRKASKGENAGKEFYGCSNYPNCRGIVNIK